MHVKNTQIQVAIDVNANIINRTLILQKE